MKKKFWKRMTAFACAGIMIVSGSSFGASDVNAAVAHEMCPWDQNLSASGYKKIPVETIWAESNQFNEDHTGTSGDGPASWMIDNNVNTHYHSNYQAIAGNGDYTQNNKIIMTLNSPNTVNGISYLRRIEADNGIWKDFKVYVSTEKLTADQAGSDKWIPVSEKGGNEVFTAAALNKDQRFDQEFLFSQPAENVQSIKIEVKNPHSTSGRFISAAEVGVIGTERVRENVARGKKVTTGYIDGTVADINKDRPLTMIVDGIKNDVDENYGDIGTDGVKKACYIQVDLGNVYDISGMRLYRYWKTANRKYKDTLIVAGNTEDDFTNKTAKVIYNGDKQDLYGFGAGQEEDYNESYQGKEIPVASGVQGRYVRVYTNGRTDGETVHILELEVYGALANADYSVLNQIITDADSRFSDKVGEKKEWYTSDSIATFENALAAAKNIVAQNLKSDHQAEVDGAVTTLNNAIDNLKIKVVVPDESSDFSSKDYTVTTDKGYSELFKYNAKCTLPAPSPEAGKEFTGWKLGEDVVYQGTGDYEFYVTGNYSFTAMYETVTVQSKAILKDVIVTPGTKEGRSNIRFTAQIIVPQGKTLKEAGLMWGIDNAPSTRKLMAKQCNQQYQFSITIKNVPEGRSVHGYIYAYLNELNEMLKSGERKAVAPQNV